MAETISADYVVVGAGAMGMAFVDSLLDETTNKTIVMLDQNEKPGGHWTKTYPYVRLHQPAAYYGVNSTALDAGTIDESGWNKGLSTLATGSEICEYFDKIMQEKFLGSGRVRFFPKHVLNGERQFESLETGKKYEIGQQCTIVDASYSRTTIPSSRPPPYPVAEGIDCLPPNQLPDRFKSGKYANFTVIGSGKTGIDACLWLLESNVSPGNIKWIMPRDAYYFDRGAFQPIPEQLEQKLARTQEQQETIMSASSVDDFFRRQVEGDHSFQLDASIKPTMHHCATVSRIELDALKDIRGSIVRKGHVTEITAEKVVLEDGSFEAKPDTLYVDCSASAIKKRPLKPVFEEKNITLQPVRFCQQTFSSALIGHVEATYGNDIKTKNSLCGPVDMPDKPADYLLVMQQTNFNNLQWLDHPKTAAWIGDSRLNIFKDVMPFGNPEAVSMLKAGMEAMSQKICGLLLDSEHHDEAKEMLEKLQAVAGAEQASL